MKKKIVGILICTLLIISTFPIIDAKDEKIYFDNQIFYEEISGCAGAIATGSVVKNGRSLFWKNRHQSGENNKPFFFPGTVYKYYGIGQAAADCLMGINENGLAVGNFVVYGPIDNWEYISDRTKKEGSQIMHYLLDNFDCVYDAAMFSALHIDGNGQMGIVSSEPGVGAIVAYSNDDGTCRTNITWVNNTYAALANAFYCDGDHDTDGNDITIDNMLYDITTNGGINGDFKIDWEEVCQRGGKNVSGKEEGDGTFYSASDITNPWCVSGFVAVSGNPEYDGASNIGFLAMGRQPLVGIWLPLAASCLTETEDIPHEYRDGGGIEDYVDSKIYYATLGFGQGGGVFDCERVREILEVTNGNESSMFNTFDEIIEDIPPEATPSEVKSILYSFVEETVPNLISVYESLNHQPDAPSINGPTSVSSKEVYSFSFNTTDPDDNPVMYYVDWGDGTNSGWTECTDSGVEIILKHTWTKIGTYTITAKAKDIYDLEGLEGTLEITVPRERFNNYNIKLINWLLEHFPLLERLWGLIIN